MKFLVNLVGKKEIEKELTDAGFVNLKFNHRHGYSWTVVGENS
jgi:hypothetical protein